ATRAATRTSASPVPRITAEVPPPIRPSENRKFLQPAPRPDRERRQVASSHGFPLHLVSKQFRVAHHSIPCDSLKRFSVGRYRCRVHGRDDNACVGYLSGVPAIAA